MKQALALELLAFDFAQRALVAGVVIAAVCSVIGALIVLRRMAMIGDGLAHIAFGGIAFGIFTNFVPIWSALVFTILGAIGITKVQESARLPGDAALAIFFSLGLSIGVILTSLSHGFNANLFSFLFGSILLTSLSDLLIVTSIAGFVIITVLLFYKEFFALIFDEESARVSGLPTRKLNYLLSVLTGITVIASIRIVGILLVSSLLVIPAVTAMQLSKGFNETIYLSILFSVIAVTVGLNLALITNISPSGVIALTSTATFFVTLVTKWLRVRKVSIK